MNDKIIIECLAKQLDQFDTTGLADLRLTIDSRGRFTALAWTNNLNRMEAGSGENIAEAFDNLRKRIPHPSELAKIKRAQAARLITEAAEIEMEEIS